MKRLLCCFVFFTFFLLSFNSACNDEDNDADDDVTDDDTDDDADDDTDDDDDDDDDDDTTLGPEIELSNGITSLLFDVSSADTLQSITNLASGQVFTSGNSAVWKLNTLDTSAGPPFNESLDWIAEFTADVPSSYELDDLSNPKMLSLSWNNVNLLGEGTVDVEVEIKLIDGDPLSYWNIAFSNNTSSRYSLFSVDFPLLSMGPLGDGEDDYLVLSELTGTLIPNPSERVNCRVTHSTDLVPSGRTKDGEYPGWWGLQFGAFYDDGSDGEADGLGGGAGLYLATYDPDGYRKRFNYVGDAGGINYFVRHYPENNQIAGNTYATSYSSIISPFTGDWIDASRMYRSWALDQPWCGKGTIEDRADVGQAIRNIDLVIKVNDDKFTSVEEVFQSITGEAGLIEFFGGQVTSAVHLRPWWGSWNPEVAFTPQVPTLLAELASLGIRSIPYTNLKDWQTGLEDPIAARAKATDLNGDDMITTYEGNTEYWVMDPATIAWQEHFESISVDLRNEGNATDIYIDLHTTAKLCYRQDNDHIHPQGGGKWWFEGAKELFRLVRERQDDDPDYFIGNEGKTEGLIPVVDAFFTNLWDSWGPYGIYVTASASEHARPIPLFQAIYHDYSGCFNGMNYWEDYERIQYRFLLGYNLVNGNKLQYADDRSQALRVWGAEETEDKTYLKTLVEGCDLAQRYLVYGQWMRPPAITAPTTIVPMGWDQYEKDYEMPAVLAAAYKNANAETLGLIFTNFTDSQVTADFSVDLDDYDLPTGVTTVTELTDLGFPNDVVTQATYSGSFSFPPMSMLVLEMGN